MPECPVDLTGRPFHFIGVGGIGMSALAYVLARRALPISGSDAHLNGITEKLQDLGVHVFQNQSAGNLAAWQQVPPSGRPQVVCSTAIGAGNAEYQAAVELGCPILHRSDVLAALTCEYESLLVAGTHGKTTTSSLLGYTLLEVGLDPTIVVGGEVTAWGGNARVGAGPHLVAEADESDGSLVKFTGSLGIITNIELDHTNHFQDLAQVVDTFQQFAQRCQHLVVCWDCPTIRQHFTGAITYGLGPDAAYRATEIHYGATGTTARIWERGVLLGTLHLQLLGEHNLRNALAVVAAGRQLGLAFADLAQAMEGFTGAKRRFERRGQAGDIDFIDDYAHHPSEIRATLNAARQRLQTPRAHGGRVVAVFQPHRYSRTVSFFEEFAQAFTEADLVVLTDIYSAGETNTWGITGETLAQQVANHHPAVHYAATLGDLETRLPSLLRPGDLVLFLGAGNVNRAIPSLVRFFQEQEASVAAPVAARVGGF
ncbi:MAG: UDP-N-acetylmuramate--L-alanine ligase [Gloeomargaritaceae cyanobacterium C42_A2020_066]|nr:UDP-N-acetylmuramate--L-alanine ligase [Gloeomargaritaceae cyanobacterium C42_A2020_066]